MVHILVIRVFITKEETATKKENESLHLSGPDLPRGYISVNCKQRGILYTVPEYTTLVFIVLFIFAHMLYFLENLFTMCRNTLATPCMLNTAALHSAWCIMLYLYP